VQHLVLRVQVCSLLVQCVGVRRINEICELCTTPLDPPSDVVGTTLFDYVHDFLYSDAIHTVQRMIESGMLIAKAAPAMRQIGSCKAARQVRQQAGIVELSKQLGYQFRDPQLERTACIHSCAPPPPPPTSCLHPSYLIHILHTDDFS
jgi:hypothetical protein